MCNCKTHHTDYSRNLDKSKGTQIYKKKNNKMLTRLGLCNICEICNKPLEWWDGNLICHKYKNTLCFWFADTVDPGE